MNQRKYSGTNRGFFLPIEISVKIFTLCRKLVPFWRFKIEKKLFDAILPLRVWNHKVLCVRSQYESNMCLCFVQKYPIEIRRCQR